MEYFDYVTRDRATGKILRGIVTADDIESAGDILKRRGEDIIQLYVMKDFLSIRQTIYNMSVKPRKKVVLEFLTMLKFMLESGMSLHESLVTIRDSSINKQLKNLSREIADEVRKGATLSIALKKTAAIEKSVIEQIGAGEESGNIVDTLGRLIKQMERDMNFKGKIKNAMIYPVIICVVMVAVLWVMMTVVVPSLADTLTSMGGELPLITKIVIGTSNALSKATPYLIIFIIAAVIAYRVLMKNKIFRLKTDALKLKIPIVGSMLEKIELSRFSRNLSAMQRSGISLVSSLATVNATVKNLFIREKIEKASRLIELSGIPLSVALSKSGDFPAMMLQLIDVGINSGQICEVLDKISEKYEAEIDTLLKRITGLIEPLLIVVVGLIAGTVVISIFLPMMNMVDFI